MELPWSEDYMLRQSHPMYNDWENENNNYDREAAEEAMADLRME